MAGVSSGKRKTTIDNLPPGVRFDPTDEELIVEYLIKKINNAQLPCNRFRELDLYKFPTPEQLTENYELKRENEWYFFTPRERKYPNGSRPKRGTPGGYWQPSGTQEVRDGRGRPIGKKTILSFYEGPPMAGKKTEWLMHEYTVVTDNGIRATPQDKNRLDDCVLCKVYKRANPRRGRPRKLAAIEAGNQRPESSSSKGSNAAGNEEVITTKEEASTSSNAGNIPILSNYQLQQQPVHQQYQGSDLPIDLGWYMTERPLMILGNNYLRPEHVRQQEQSFRLPSDQESSMIMQPVMNAPMQRQPMYRSIDQGEATMVQIHGANDQVQQQQQNVLSRAPLPDRIFDEMRYSTAAMIGFQRRCVDIIRNSGEKRFKK